MGEEDLAYAAVGNAFNLLLVEAVVEGHACCRHRRLFGDVPYLYFPDVLTVHLIGEVVLDVLEDGLLVEALVHSYGPADNFADFLVTDEVGHKQGVGEPYFLLLL